VFGPDAVGYVAKQTTLTATMCSLKELDVVLRVAEELSGEANGSILKVVVLMDEAKPSAELQARADGLGVKVMTIGEVEDLGRKNPTNATPPTGKDVAFFCYTSGE
jgi:long-chain acyl-CoA synthetase